MKKILLATMIMGMTTGLMGCTKYQIVPVDSVKIIIQLKSKQLLKIMLLSQLLKVIMHKQQLQIIHLNLKQIVEM